jgi:hypothetical protein
MKRWHDEYALTRRQWRRHRRGHVEYNMGRSQGFGPGQRPPGSDPREVDCPCDAEVGRFRKRDAHDCGRARCQVCDGYKIPKREPTRKEREADRPARPGPRPFPLTTTVQPSKLPSVRAVFSRRFAPRPG